jgi:hypothetical protein
MSSFPDYYELLEVPQTATETEIRQAYKRESLRCASSARDQNMRYMELGSVGHIRTA